MNKLAKLKYLGLNWYPYNIFNIFFLEICMDYGSKLVPTISKFDPRITSNHGR